ncbi:hypothetical protein OIDMADRAFT_58562 [Oidiodendron maius Zn]|uniref:Rhodopsin domain-containing protein n=1 Tax=Oidiodendron maius (strain Zn) TaxID=913774 RepID=A0A0C3H0V5_OIDMZ|nr:hypothetical protein OIDMADRAFT_58562 [Oidiodendron maius Zn]
MDTVSNVSQAHVVIVPMVVTTIIAVILTLLRLYVRIRMIKLFGWDDFFNVLAMLALLVVMGLVLGAVHFGLGRHIQFVAAEAARGVMLLRICEFVLIVSTVFVKISISLFLKRLFLSSKRWAWFFWAFIAFNTITSLLDAAAIFPQCKPVQFNWDKSIVGGRCWSDESINAIGIAQGSIAAGTDFILSLLPTIFLWNIKIHWKIKVGVCGIMALGFASGGFAIARTALVPSLTATHDPTWDLVPLFTWAILEATFGVIAAAAPSVRPLLGFRVEATSYAKSNSRSHSLPLHNMPSVHASRLSFSGARSKPRDPNELSEEDMNSDGGSGNGDMTTWGDNGGGIMKTTDVHIVRSQPINSGDGKLHSSSVEKLVG